MGLIKPDKRAYIKLVFLIVVLIIVIISGIKTAPWLFEHAKNPEYTRQYLAGFGNESFFVFILIQMIQVIIVIIPVDLLNICSGFVFGMPLGFVLSYLGLMLGSVIVFYISRFLGYDFVCRLISKEKIEKISGMLNSTKGTVGLFIFCCIPFISKAIIMYIAGLTPVKASRLFLIYGISRIPGTLIWVSIGANAYEKDMWGLGITIAFMLILFVVVYFLGRFYTKKEKIQS